MAKLTIDVVREFLLPMQGQEVTLDQLRHELGIEKNLPNGALNSAFDDIRTIVFHLVEQRIVSPSGKRGYYKVIKQVWPVRVFLPDRETRPPFTLMFPQDRDRQVEMDFAQDIVIREGDIVLISGLSNFGKALRNGTSVLTPNGWLSIDNLVIGDTIFDSDGRATIVQGVYPQGFRHCYRFTFNDGTFIDSDDEHLWQIQTNYSRLVKLTGHKNPNKSWHQWSILSTNKIVNLCGIGEISPRRRFIIPNNEPIQFQGRTVILDPYLLGLLLGDGGLGEYTPKISTVSPEIIAYIKELGIHVNHISKCDYRLLGISKQIRNLGLTGTKSDTKFVPRDYLFNDITTRTAVLQGLMDTDGYMHKNSQSIEYSTCSKQLANDVTFLVRSLGGRCKTYNYDSHYTKNGQRFDAKTKYRVNIKIDNLNLFRLERKAKRYKGFVKTSQRVIRRIDDIGVDMTTCIRIDSPTGLFVAKDFIVTHNTTLCLNFCGENINQHPILMGNEYTQIVPSELDPTKTDYVPSPRFTNRLEAMNWVEWVDVDGNDKFTLLPVWEDYAEHIVKDRINIIDWINLPGEYYGISPLMEGIKHAIGRGIGIIALQKNEGNTAGRGGSMTRDFADCELLLDKFGDNDVLLTIGKVKEYNKRVIGRTFAYSIVNSGMSIVNFREVRKCPKCHGFGVIKGQQCDSCDGNKYIEGGV